MAFFPRTIYNTEASFTPLFRLLDDFDKVSRQGGSPCHVARKPAPRWQPRFDVRETEGAYELHGELPGMTRDGLSIEFPEHQTLVVRGKTERAYTAGTPSPAAAPVEDSTPASVTEGSERRNSHQATVEDDDDESETKSGWEEVSADEKHASPAAEPQKPQQEQKSADKAKYWLTERSIGEFSRTFHFPARVDQDAVTASLKDGVLSVVIPKAKKPETRRVAIN